MPCTPFQLADGSRGIVCSGRTSTRCACGRPAPLLCDWKVPEHRTGTCDTPICRSCSTSPAPDKDLCPQHARAYAAWRAERSEGIHTHG